MVFVDVSGFTAMSERLGRLGAVGAEEVTDIIGATFAELLGVAYAAHGSLLKFGGDALLLWFDGDDHARRAAWAVHGMRARLREVGRLTTSAGRVQLRMSAGAHSGTFHFFLVGDSHRELIVTGPAASAVVAMESSAPTGGIVVSEAMAALLPAGCARAPAGAGRRLSRAPDWERAPAPAAVAAPPDASVVLPVELRAHLRVGAAQPEHRQVAVAFLHFDGTDDLVRSPGPGATADLLDRLVGQVQQAAEAHGVCFLATDVDRDGGKVILTAGAPRAHENDEELLLRALRSLVESEPALPLRVGVHRGRVFSGEVGPAYRRTFTVMGDAVNTAARVMARAAPGTVLATPEVLDRSATVFELRPVAPFAAKGKAEPLRAFEVGPATGSRHVPASGEVPLLGRHDEMAVVAGMLGRVGQGRGGVVDIVAEAGVGKSRLAREAAAAAGLDPVTVWCDQFEAQAAYRSLAVLLGQSVAPGAGPDGLPGALRAAIDQHAPHLAEWAPLVGWAAGQAWEPTAAVASLPEARLRPRLHEVVTELLAAVPGAGGRPWLVEDGEWLDEPSEDFLRHLAGLGEDAPVVVVVTRRPVAGRDPYAGAVPVPLDPLPPEEAAELAVAAAPRLLPAEAERIADLAGGNPLFIEELVGWGGSPDLALPDSVESSVAARIDGLDPEERAALRRLAVLGRTIRPDLVGAVMASVEPLATLSDYVEPTADGAWRFRQALFREVAYAGLPFRTRRELHASVAGRLEVIDGGTGDQVELLSTHCHHAGDHQRAWQHGPVAGVRAAERHAHAVAVAHLGWALEAARRLGVAGPEVGDVWRRHGESLSRLGSVGDAVSSYLRARRHAGDDVNLTARLHMLLGHARMGQGSVRAAVRWYRAGLAGLDAAAARGDLDAEGARNRALLLLAWSQLRTSQGRLADATALAREALGWADRSGDTSTRAVAHNLVYLCGVRGGRPDEEVGRRALALAEEAGNESLAAVIVSNLGLAADGAGRWEEATDCYRRAGEKLEGLGNVVQAAVARGNAAWVDSKRGLVDQGCDQLERVHRLLEVANPAYADVFAVDLGRTLAVAGRPDEAIEMLQGAAIRLRSAGMAETAAEADVWRAEALTLAGRPDDALALVPVGPPPAPADASSHAAQQRRVQASALAAAGHTGEARRVVDDALALARAAGDRFAEGLALEVAANLGDEAAVAEARSVLGELGVVATFPPPPLVSVLTFVPAG